MRDFSHQNVAVNKLCLQFEKHVKNLKKLVKNCKSEKMESIQHGSEVSEVQQDLVRLNLKIRSQIETFQTIDTNESMTKLNGDIRGNFEEMRNKIGHLRFLAKKQSDLNSGSMLKTDANNHEDQMTACLIAFKKANLACISRLNSQGSESLFGPKNRSRDLGSKDKEEMVKESGRATDQLMRISRNLAQTVENSSKTMDELVTSSKTLNDANEEFKTHGSLVGQGRKLITKYVRRGVTDQVLIFLAAAFFFAVVFYILRKRVLGPFDPFSLIWSSIVAFVQTLLNLLIPNEEEPEVTEVPDVKIEL